MFVDSTIRRIGAGPVILEGLLDEAKKVGYKKVRLDSPKFMEAAHSLYRSFGFHDIEALRKWKSQQNLKTIWCLWNQIYLKKK